MEGGARRHPSPVHVRCQTFICPLGWGCRVGFQLQVNFYARNGLVNHQSWSFGGRLGGGTRRPHMAAVSHAAFVNLPFDLASRLNETKSVPPTNDLGWAFVERSFSLSNDVRELLLKFCCAFSRSLIR